jgi:uncharacterized protein (UPF0332 family)
MKFNWGKYLTLAQDWADLSKGHVNEEALLRSAISRAYYASFCNARNYLRDIEKDRGLGKSLQVHQLVIERFERSDSKAKKDIGTVLGRLRKIRNIADYRDTFHDLEATALQSLQYAEEVIEELEKLRV